MGLKYAEVKIALTDREERGGGFLGGAPVRLSKMGHKKLAYAFCILCALASFGTGNLTQVGSMTSFFETAGIPKALGAVICVALISLAVFGGRGRIADITAFIVPVASAVYLLAVVLMLGMNRENIIPAFGKIFSEAFGFSAVAGGFSGAVLSHVIREGFVRSPFSNEAGMGSSPLVYATAEIADPRIQAKWGIFEIFFDTFIVSSLTAVLLLSFGTNDASEVFFFVFGDIGKWIFGGLISVFAFASVISWCYYAECCLSFVFRKRRTALTVYRVTFTLCAFFGVFLAEKMIWEISDVLNAFMMFPNLFLLFKCRNEIERMI
jgi:AGCS family alanine or glycine:cation symporter